MVAETAMLDEVASPATASGIDPLSDVSLVRDVIGGSQDALAGLYDRHWDAVFSTALRTSRDRWLAAEVVQETFLALWNRAEQFDPSRGTLRAWLLTVARNRAIDRLRAAARHERDTTFSSFARTEADDQSTAEWLAGTGELIGAALPEPTPEVALSSKEARASMEIAVASLDPAERHVIALAYGAGLSQSEIAARLGWPIGTVKTRTRRALQRLREQLDRRQASVRSPGQANERMANDAAVTAHVSGPAGRPGDHQWSSMSPLRPNRRAGDRGALAITVPLQRSECGACPG